MGMVKQLFPRTGPPGRSGRGVARKGLGVALPALLLAIAVPAHASMFKGEALDKLADVLTWVVLIVAPIAAIVIFLLIHILPEKIAEKKKHPQAKAIQCLCLLSLVFGGMLWPLAWLWAFTKPVLHQLAYGTDVHERDHGEPEPPAPLAEAEELQRLRERIAELEGRLVAPVVTVAPLKEEAVGEGATD